MTKPMSKKIEALLNKGLSNKEIIARLKCPPQQVYNTRYYIKKRDEASKPKRKTITVVKRPEKVAPPEPMPTEVVESPEVRAPLITYYEEPSLWQRIKRWIWAE